MQLLERIQAYLAPLKQIILKINSKLVKRPFLNYTVKGFLLIFTSIFSILFGLIFFTRIGLFGGMPSNSELKKISNPVGTELYADDGKTIFRRYFIENRTNVKFEEISLFLIDALICTEDIRYYDHNGIDWKSWVRVLWKTILKGEKDQGGGSTISQQLAKNLFKRRRYWKGTTLINKVREIIIAQRLEKIYTKEELLTLYFNTVSFGGNIYGVEVASKQLFNTTPKKLKIEEAAILIGMLKATTKYNPMNNLDLAKQRRNTVFSKMEKYGKLTQIQADSLSRIPITLHIIKETHNEGIATYFGEHARIDIVKALEAVPKPDGTPYNIYTDGLKVYTSINLKLQEFAENAVKEHMTELQNLFEGQLKWNKKPWDDTLFLQKAIQTTERYQSLTAAKKSQKFIDSVFNHSYEMEIYSPQGALKKKLSPKDSLIYYLKYLTAGYLAAEPSTGFIKAWVGGIDNKFFQYDHVKAKRHVGSTFKPIVYAAGLQEGLRACDFYSNEYKIFHEYEDWTPKNFEGGYGGFYSMKGALTKSLNLVTIDILLKAGIENVIRHANKMGITSEIPVEPAIGLGAVDISLFDMISAYSVICNRGAKTNITYIKKIVTKEGEVLIDNTKPITKRDTVLNPKNADLVRDMMENVINAGTGGSIRWRYDVREKLAGKTGTTQENADGWFIAFNPGLISGSWVGGEYPEIHLAGGYTGAFTALPIVGKVLNKIERDPILKSMVKESFPPLTNEERDSLNCPNFKPSLYGSGFDDLLDSTLIDSTYEQDILNGDGIENDQKDSIAPSSSEVETKNTDDKTKNKNDRSKLASPEGVLTKPQEKTGARKQDKKIE